MKKSLFHISALLFFTLNMMGQTSNEGMLYVSEDTKFSTVERFNNLDTGSFFNDGDVYIHSDFNNDGILDFYQNTGLTNFIGRAKQTISGTKMSYLYNVYFNNSSNSVPFEVSGGINISGQADLFEGILDNDNFGGEITFNTSAYHINTSDYSYVDGTVHKLGNKEFIFPIGDKGYYRFGGISAPSNNESLFQGKFYYENSNDIHPHSSKFESLEEIDNQEYWTIEKKSISNEDMLVSLSWSDFTTPQSMIDAAKQNVLTIVRWNEDTNMWTDEGGAIDIQSKTVSTAVSGYGVFTFGRLKSDLLPCDIVIYTAVTPNGDGNNDYFLIDTSNNECANNLHLQVYNRWGVKVFESNNYGVDGDVFDGFSSGRITVNDSKQLPTGTYYYILEYQYDNPSENNRHKQAGFLYLSGN